MDRALIVLAVVAAVAVLVLLLRRRRETGAPTRVDLRELELEGDGVAVVGFSGPYCLACRAWESQLERAGVPWSKVDVSVRPDLARRYGVRATPLVLAVSLPDGRVIESYDGDPQEAQVERLGALARSVGAGAAGGGRAD
jgi:hypothetical protein